MNAAVKYTGGLFSWTLAEYFLHKELGHRVHSRLRVQHLEHHRCPELPSSPKWSLVALALIVTGEPFLMGMVFGYFAYTFVHHRQHHSNSPNRHAIHHGQGDVNFGVTSALWDKAFGSEWRERSH